MDVEAGPLVQLDNVDQVRYGQFVINKRKKSVARITSAAVMPATTSMDAAAVTGSSDASEVRLTARELQVLLLLMENRGRIMDREELLKEAWGYGFYGKSRAVDNLIRRLREKIELNPENPRYIMTKWGHGYYFDSRTLIEDIEVVE